MIARWAAATIAAGALLGAGCGEPPLPPTTVIVGATLLNGSNPPLPNAVVVVRDGRIAAFGPQQTTPIPAGSAKVDATGKFVAAAAPDSGWDNGRRADLVVLAGDAKTVERRMSGGKWIDP